MMTMSDLSGYIASVLVLLTFMTRDMRLLRTIAILSNFAFITYGAIGMLLPVLFLHLLLLPLNVIRLRELLRSSQKDRSVTRQSRLVHRFHETDHLLAMRETGASWGKTVSALTPSL
jgi:hypothetical protein